MCGCVKENMGGTIDFLKGFSKDYYHTDFKHFATFHLNLASYNVTAETKTRQNKIRKTLQNITKRH